MNRIFKTSAGARIKELHEDGHGLAVIATLNVIDRDGDVTLPGAFGEQPAKMVPAHDWKHVPLGKAEIREEGNEVLAAFRLNLEIESARDWHAALKHDLANGPPLQEWSYGFSVVEASFGEHEGHEVRFLKKLDVHEVSPVMMGAGVGTRTVAVKGNNGGRLADQLGAALRDAKAVIERCGAIREVRKGDGRDLSPDRLADLKSLQEAFGELSAAKEALDGVLSHVGESVQAAAVQAEELLAEFSRVSHVASARLR